MTLGVHGMELRMTRLMAVEHLMVVVMLGVSSPDFILCMDLEG